MRPALLLPLLLLIAGAAAAEPAAPICTDRPTKSTGTCTADAGHLQLESDLVNLTDQSLDGAHTRTLGLLNPTLKYGLSPTLDVELNVPVYLDVRIHDGTGTASSHGSGDVWLKLKAQLYSGANVGIALLPQVKAPTASHELGNGRWEGGVLLPVVAKLSDAWSLNLSPELDLLANAAGRGYHLNHAQLINLGRSLPHDVTLSMELWGDWNADPAGHQAQVSFDLGGAWLLGPDRQLDGGVNLGLNRQTPGLQAYLGWSQRF